MSINPEDEGAQTDFSRDMSYGDYLSLDKLLSAQNPRSDAHDEMLFVVQHHVSELWMKLAIHEITAAREALRRDEFRAAFKMLARVSRIFEQLNNAWDVLRTMTPNDYESFRDALGASSGFQSAQYRMIEFLLGNRNAHMLKPHQHDAETHAKLEAELATPSLYDEALRAMARSGVAVPEPVLARDVREQYAPHAEVAAAWASVYRDTDAHWHLYELAEKLVDFEDYFRRWRFNHVTTVERVIGFKRGTGGTGGVSYLRRMLEVELFPELWHMRTEL